MPTATLNGWKITYETSGVGPPIVLVHGLLMDRTMFAPQVEMLKEKYTVITPDLRNHGESESRAEDFTQWDMMDDHIALCAKLGVEKAVFGGVSQGGFQSLRAALKYPEKVAGLILIETQAGPEDPGTAPIYESMGEVVVEDGWNDFLLESASAVMMAAQTSSDLKSSWIQRWRNLTEAHVSHTLRSVTRRDDITDRLGEINAPALVVHGEQDAAISMDRAQQLTDGLPNLVEFVKLPDAGHSATVEDPEGVNLAVQRFLDKIYPA